MGQNNRNNRFILVEKLLHLQLQNEISGIIFHIIPDLLRADYF